MSAVEFLIKIADRASGPLKHIQGAFRQVEQAAKINVAAPSIQAPNAGGFLSYILGLKSQASSALSGIGGGGAQSLDELGAAGVSSLGGIVTKAGAAGAAVMAIGAIAGQASGALSSLGNGLMAVSHFAISAAGFKGDTLLAFKYLLSGKEQAEQAYKLVQTMADKTPMTDKQVVGMFKSLVGSGYTTQTTSQLVAAMADLSMTASSQQLDSVVLSLTKMKGAGKVDQEILNMMAEGSGGVVDVGSFKAALAKVTGQKSEEVQKLLSSGKVTAEQGQAAFFEVIKKKFYQGDPAAVLGSAADEKSRTLGGQLSTLGGRMQRLFADVDITPLASAIGLLNDSLESPAAGELKVAMEGFFRAFFGGAAGMKGADLAALFRAAVPVVHVLTGAVRNVSNILWTVLLPAGKAAWGTFSSILGTTLAPLQTLLGGLVGLSGGNAGVVMLSSAFRILATITAVFATVLVYALTVLGAMSGVTVTVFGLLASGITGLVDGVVGVLSSAYGAISGFVGQMVSAGVDLIYGLLEGIVSGGQAVVEAASSVASGITSAVKSALRISSPSRVMVELGGYTSAGLASGLERGVPQVQRGALRLVHSIREEGTRGTESLSLGLRTASVRPELRTVGGQSPREQIQTSGERTGNQYTFSITVNGDGEPLAAKVKQAVLDALREAGESIGTAEHAA